MGVTDACTSADKRATFRKLHESGCFIIPNPFDVGSAKALQHLGFKALASTSAGFAWTIAKADNHVTRRRYLRSSRRDLRGGRLPVNADFEDGFAIEPARSAPTSHAGSRPALPAFRSRILPATIAKPLFDRTLAIERIKAAREAIDADNSGVLLTGRCEAFLGDKRI